MSLNQDRFERQRDLIPQERLETLSCTVIGVGAIGRNVAVQLAAIGVRRIQLIDFDVVDDTNITTQGYLASDVGQTKVAATSTAIQQIDQTIHVETINDQRSISSNAISRQRNLLLCRFHLSACNDLALSTIAVSILV